MIYMLNCRRTCPLPACARLQGYSVAIKMLPKMFLGDANQADMETFVQEVAVLSAVEHDNVVKFFGGCLQPPYVFIVEELMVRSLADVLYKTEEVRGRVRCLESKR